jgi:hypothetical protein
LIADFDVDEFLRQVRADRVQLSNYNSGVRY